MFVRSFLSMLNPDSKMNRRLLLKSKFKRITCRTNCYRYLDLYKEEKEVVGKEAQKTFTKLLMPQSYFSRVFLLVLKLLNMCSTYTQDE